MKKCDILIVGAGAAGCAAALLASNFRQSVILVEHDKVGGTTLHRGCTSVRSMLVSARNVKNRNLAQDSGVGFVTRQETLVDFLTRQRSIVSKCFEDLSHQLNKGGIQILRGTARLTSPVSAEVTYLGNKEDIECRKIILATGSRPIIPPEIPMDGSYFMSSEHVLNMTELPKSLLIVGGGTVPCEYATIFSSLGCAVTIIEKDEILLPKMDHSVGKFLKNTFASAGVEVFLNSQAVKAWKTDDAVHVKINDGREMSAERLVVSVGRYPNMENLSLEKAGVRISDQIEVDSRLETSQPGIYAVGDCNNLVFMANAAILQARIAVLNALGEDHRFEPRNLPYCLYITPEIGAVGWSETQAIKAGFDVIVAQCPFSGVGRAATMGDLGGFVKLIADRPSQRLLGGVIVGGQAAEMIGQISVPLSLSATIPDLINIAAPHPTLSEAVQEAMWQLYYKLRQR